MRILIVESETPEVLKKSGRSHATAYGEELQRVSSEVCYIITAPYLENLSIGELERVDGVVFPGAGVSWSADATEGLPLRAAMAMVFDAGLPCFGSCNGMQLAAVVLGGTVQSGDLEVGIARDIQLTDEGKQHPMMQGRTPTFSAPTVHGDKVTELPTGAVHLASNAHTRYQSFAYSLNGVDFWGVEYHPEIAAAEIAQYVEDNPGKFVGYADLVEQLRAAELDNNAAVAIGTSTQDMAFTTRTTELRNWLHHVSRRAPGERD